MNSEYDLSKMKNRKNPFDTGSKEQEEAFPRSQELIERPSESLSVEIKRWIDPANKTGQSKIVRTILALRNHGGGYLIIGFDNEVFQPDVENVPANPKISFHIDLIQGLVSHFSSEAFEITVEFPEREGQVYPVIVVPPGVKTPVASKSDLIDNDSKLISTDDVYVRSLRANNTPSTAKANWKDWSALVEVCFDNREADIGRFMHRHLSRLKPEMLREFASTLAKGIEPEISINEHLKRYLENGAERYDNIILERSLNLPKHGAWEVALIFSGEVPEHKANRDFLNLLDSSNPRYTRWPVWLDSRKFNDESARPKVNEGSWEAFIVSIQSGWSNHLDYMRLDPKGRFYLRRAFEDDLSRNTRALGPLTVLDFGLPVIRVAETMAVGFAFAKAMKCDPDSTNLYFAFRWGGLNGRTLDSWAQPDRFISPGHRAYQDEVTAFLNVPLDTPLSALSEFVNQAVTPLFEVFDGFVLSKDVVEDLTRRLIERRL